LLCLLPCAACSGRNEVVTVPQIIHVRPPRHLLMPTPVPVCDPCEVNEDLLRYAEDLRAALLRANADKAAIRESTEGLP